MDAWKRENKTREIGRKKDIYTATAVVFCPVPFLRLYFVFLSSSRTCKLSNDVSLLLRFIIEKYLEIFLFRKTIHQRFLSFPHISKSKHRRIHQNFASDHFWHQLPSPGCFLYIRCALAWSLITHVIMIRIILSTSFCNIVMFFF